LLGLYDPDRSATYQALFEDAQTIVTTAGIVDRMRHADSSIRGAYVIHGPIDVRIVVGHRDTHRSPGAVKLEVGDIVRLTAQSTELWIPVCVTAQPESPVDFYSGVIVEQLVAASRYQTGNGVRFSEDQFVVETPRAVLSWARRWRY
jgi:hypothetical protein